MDAEQQAAEGIVAGYILRNPRSSAATSIAPPIDKANKVAYGE